MHLWQIIILAFGVLGIFNSLAFIIYLQLKGKQSVLQNIYLRIILLAFVLQITKALLELFNLEFSPYVNNLYLLGIYSQGPAMYLFIRKALTPRLAVWPKQFLIHFLPYLILSVIRYDFDHPEAKEWFAIYLVGIQSLAYILLCIRPYLSVRKNYFEGNRQFYFIVYLFPVFAAMWISFPISGFTRINNQVFESIFYPLFIYYLIILKFKEPRNEKEKYKFTGIDEATSLEIFNEVSQAIKQKELYLNPDITLNVLAKKVTIQVNILSQVINQNAHLNFRDFINTFRIEKAREQITEKVQKGFTIASIAFDCGFNSLSAFNRAFKKGTGYTPSEFIRANS